MFILYAVAIGLILGLVLRGNPGRLGEMRFRWAPLIVVGTLVQLALFSEPVTARIGSLGAPIYVGSTALVLVAVLRNVRIPGIVVVAAGATSNLAAIVANGGYMPASAAALGAHAGGSGYSNSAVVANPALGPLTDVFALPAWIPAANVFSIGDVLIATGIVVAIVVRMRTAPLVDVQDRLVRFEPFVGGPASPSVRRPPIP